jgi:hypothetical protein
MALHAYDLQPLRENPWQWWLEESPLAAWGTFRPRTGSRGFTNYWKGKQSDVWGDYQGALGQQVLGGGEPNINWLDYLNNYQFSDRFKSLPPGERGESNRAFAPQVRWNFG